VPIILGNTTACSMAAYIIYMKLRHG
jgi:hypothetical protein